MRPFNELATFLFAVATAAAPAPAPTASPAPGSAAWKNEILNAHNLHRANHSDSPLVWANGLAQAAQLVAARCDLSGSLTIGDSVSGFSQIGQNLFGSSGDAASVDVTDAINNVWYAQEGLYESSGSYGLPNAPLGSETAAFTQIVWAGTTSVGCAIADCPNGVEGGEFMTSLFVCDYGPKGNLPEEYAQNVHQPLGKAPAS